uniref:AIG1-type G domain-containing protein n=1 Tax=Nothobranchius furzeri TaxID=105023 RepID=A0A8C6L6X4_NOTFU
MLLLGPSHETRSSRGAAVTDRAQSHTSDFVSKHNNKQEKTTLWFVLIGNSWSAKCLFGNVLLGQSRFLREEEPESCVSVRGQVKERDLVLINTPNLLLPSTSQNKLTQLIKHCVRLSAPGPHLFLLVLESETFTEEQNVRLRKILEYFSGQSFAHSVVMEPNLRDAGDWVNYMNQRTLEGLVKECRGHFLWKKTTEPSEAGKMMLMSTGPRRVLARPLRPEPSGSEFGQSGLHLYGATRKGKMLKIVLFGKSEQKKTIVGNLLISKTGALFQKSSLSTRCDVISGVWRSDSMTVVKTPNFFRMSDEAIREEMRRCVDFCRPGPNVLLLLMKPSTFTHRKKQVLLSIFWLFEQDAFKHSMVIKTHDLKECQSVNQLINNCDGRQFNLSEDNQTTLREKVRSIVSKNRESFLTLAGENQRPEIKPIRRHLNLVLCGRRGAGKTSAAKVILGQTELQWVSSSSECVRNQGEVCGRWLSLVELPALYGKAPQEVMEESFRCISLCDPEGVHAFLLVLPVGPLTDEDKGELQTIQDTFSSDFTMILFTVDSDPTAPAVVDFIRGSRDIQELRESCRGRSVVLNIRNQQQVPDLLEAVEKRMRSNKFRNSFTTETFSYLQMCKENDEKISSQQAELKPDSE